MTQSEVWEASKGRFAAYLRGVAAAAAAKGLDDGAPEDWVDEEGPTYSVMLVEPRGRRVARAGGRRRVVTVSLRVERPHRDGTVRIVLWAEEEGRQRKWVTFGPVADADDLAEALDLLEAEETPAEVGEEAALWLVP